MDVKQEHRLSYERDVGHFFNWVETDTPAQFTLHSTSHLEELNSELIISLWCVIELLIAVETNPNKTNVPGVSFAQVASCRIEDRLVLHHLHNTFRV